MFYPLKDPAHKEWTEIVQLPVEDYLSRLQEKAHEYDCRQESHGEVVSWFGRTGNLELMLFRIPDPGNLDAVQTIYASIVESNCPIGHPAHPPT